MRKIRKIISVVAGVAALFGLSYCTYGYISAEDRVKAICGGIKPGDPVSEAAQFALSEGLSGTLHDTGVGYLVEARTFGRYGCKVVTEQAAVVSSEYNFAD